MASNVLLEVTNLTVSYGQLPALREVSLSLDEGATLAVIGANGAGKSTLLKALAGQLPVDAGSIKLAGHELIGVSAHKRAKHGISLVPEGRRLFKSLTVEENLLIGTTAKRSGPWSLDSVYEALPIVAERKNRFAGDLSGGEAQVTAIARALVANPKVLLLDEVSLGLAPVIVRQIYAILPTILEQGTAILLVEQDVQQARSAAQDVHCLLQGRTALAGRNLSFEEISRAYFGAEE